MASYWSIAEPANIGAMTALPRAGRWESQLMGDQRSSIVNETNGGVRTGYELFSRSCLPGVIFEFPTEYASQYRAISAATQGRVLPFWFVIDGNDFGGLQNIRLEEDNFIPETINVVGFNGTLQQWLRWTMRASAEVEDQPLED